MATLKGIWKFKESIEFPSTTISNEDEVLFNSYNSPPEGYNGFLVVPDGVFSPDPNTPPRGIGYWIGSVTISVYDARRGWEYEDYRTVDFGTTEQEVSDNFYTWFTANATQQAAEPTKTTITYNGTAIASLEAGQSATLSCQGKKMKTDIVVKAGSGGEVVSTYAFYNGVKLPKIPEDVLAQYPHAVIRNNTTSGYYDLLLSLVPFYKGDTGIHGCYNADSLTYDVWYRTSIDSPYIWERQSHNFGSWGIDADRPILWSNHDIPNGSATATDIYFEGTDSVPIEEPKPPKTTITYNGTNTAVASGKTATLKCEGKKMKTDVVVSVISDLPQITPAPTITLDGNTLNIFDESGLATSATVYVDGEAKETVSLVKLISFTLAKWDGTFIASLQAEEGMTWEQWAVSKYNTVGIFIDLQSSTLGEVFYPTETYNAPLFNPGTMTTLYASSEIIPNMEYQHD